MATFPGASIAWLAATLTLSCGIAAAQPRMANQLARFGVAESAWPPAPPGTAGRPSLRILDPPLAASQTCMVPWLQCSAVGSLEARTREQHAFLNGRRAGDDAMAGRRTLVHALSAGMRFHFPDTRSAQHGPWSVQLSVSRRSPTFNGNLPARRRTGISLTIGTEF